jgi:hypothetical protein
MLYVILSHDAPAHGALIAKAFTRPRNRGNSTQMKGPQSPR